MVRSITLDPTIEPRNFWNLYQRTIESQAKTFVYIFCSFNISGNISLFPFEFSEIAQSPMRRNFFEELRVQVNSTRQGNSNLSLVDTVSIFALNLRLSNVETLVSMYNLSLDFISRFFRRNGLLRFMKNIFCTPRAKGILCLCYVRSRVETVPDHICLTAIIHVTYVRTFATKNLAIAWWGGFAPGLTTRRLRLLSARLFRSLLLTDSYNARYGN